MPHSILFDNVSFAFDNQLALENISLEIKEKDFVGIIGPNGGGKTTFLRLILGILKPTRGKITISGKPAEKMQHYMGYVPQFSSMDQRFPINVREVVAMGLAHSRSFMPWHKKQDLDKIYESLKMVDIENLADKQFGELSGGQRQRCLIARALVAQPHFLLLDEPTASVDSTVEHDIYELFRILNKEITIILVSHDLGFISSYVNTVVCINQRLVSHAIDDMDVIRVINDAYHSNVAMLHHKCKL